MIQHAFTSAYTNQVSAQNQGIGTIAGGVKDAATLIVGALGFAGALGSGAFATGAKHALAGRLGGVGGNIMLATMQQKKDSAVAKAATSQLFTSEEVGSTIKAQLGNNPINRPALKTLGTVFETLVKAREQEIMNEKGKIQSNMGDIDPNSELGKKILSNLEKEDKK